MAVKKEENKPVVLGHYVEKEDGIFIIYGCIDGNFVEFDEIPYEFDSDGKPKSYVLTLKDGYEEAEKLNRRHIQYNSKRQKVCYTWRKKQFHWFMNNITNLWW